MAKQFKVGDRVKMNKAGVKQFGDQSKGSAGVIEQAADGDGWFWVKWEAGNGNNYKTEHLKREAKPAKLEEKLYTDDAEDLLEVDTVTSTDKVYFTTAEAEDGTVDAGQIFAADVAMVKKIRKQLKVWLDKHNHNA